MHLSPVDLPARDAPEPGAARAADAPARQHRRRGGALGLLAPVALRELQPAVRGTSLGHRVRASVSAESRQPPYGPLNLRCRSSQHAKKRNSRPCARQPTPSNAGLRHHYLPLSCHRARNAGPRPALVPAAPVYGGAARMVPLQTTVEDFGATVRLDSFANAFTVARNGTLVRLKPGSRSVDQRPAAAARRARGAAQGHA